MADDTLIKAASVILLEQISSTLKSIAEKHNKKDAVEYLDNILLISMIGHIISTGTDKERVVNYFLEIVKELNEKEAELLIKQAISHANITKRK